MTKGHSAVHVVIISSVGDQIDVLLSPCVAAG